MNSAWRWKASAALIFSFLAVWFVLPNFIEVPTPKEGEEIPWYYKVLPDSEVRLGLDLQGGIHMVLGIDLRRALMNEADRYAQDLRDISSEEDFTLEVVERDFDSINLRAKLRPEDSGKFEKFIRTKFTVLRANQRDSSTGTYLLEIVEQRQREVEKQTIDQALETLRNRLDEFGVAEPSIQAQGKDRIIVQLPGLADPSRARNVLGRTAQLEFKIVEDEGMDVAKLDRLFETARKKIPAGSSTEELNRELQGKIPPGTEVLVGEEADPTTGEVIEAPYLLKVETLLTGDMLEDARIGAGEFNQPTVNLRFNRRGAEILDKITAENLNKRLAIILDDKVQSDPVIRARISDGRPQITFGGLKSRNQILADAKDLALVLRAGALPAPVEILQSRAVGPSLGRDSIERGFKAVLIGIFATIILMAMYYRLSGITADLAVIVNVIFILASLGALHATLTLPGIAGILISIGMAVDANVIIYERIREELRSGKLIKAAIEAGYERAHLTILDANLTTIITAIVLLQYGTGPIKGFAVTLIFGLIANYFTALWFTRLAYEWILTRFNPKRLSI